MAEKLNSYTPYNYCANSPINGIDPDGMLSKSFMDDIWNQSGEGETQWQNKGNGNFAGNNGKSVGEGQGDDKKKNPGAPTPPNVDLLTGGDKNNEVGQEANSNYGFTGTVLGSQAMMVEKAAELANEGGQATQWLSKVQSISKWGGAATNAFGTGLSIYNFNQTGKIKLSDAVGLIGTGVALTGLVISAPVVGTAGLIIGGGSLIFGGFMDKTTIYDSKKGGLQFNYYK